MPAAGTILVGTIGQGIHRSDDNGESWTRPLINGGIHAECIARCLAPRLDGSETVFAGTDLGLYRTDDGGRMWQLLDTPMNRRTIWSLQINPNNLDMMVCGTGTPDRPGVFSSHDGGKNWVEGKADFAEFCPAVGIPRVLGVSIDTSNPDVVWAGCEVDGVRRSKDGGKSWENVAENIGNPDVHQVFVTNGKKRRVLVLVNNDLHISEDDGESWRAAGAPQKFPWHYTRNMTVHPEDPDTIFVCCGDSTPGKTGALMRSKDAGETWEALPLGKQPNSAIWTAHIYRHNPNLMFTASRYGYLYRSEDGGDSWMRYWREFSDISSIAFIPA